MAWKPNRPASFAAKSTSVTAKDDLVFSIDMLGPVQLLEYRALDLKEEEDVMVLDHMKLPALFENISGSTLY